MSPDGRMIDRQRVDRLSEAAEWLLRLQQPERTEEEYTEWLRWCDADPENLGAFETVQARWQDLDALKGGVGVSAANIHGAEPQHAFKLTAEQRRVLLEQEAGSPSGVLSEADKRRRSSGRRLRLPAKAVWAIAASVGTLAVALAVVRFIGGATAEPAQKVVTDLTNRATTLPDGSRMILGAQSRVDVDFNGPQRQLDLSSGEAYFKVKHDRARPFVVKAGEVSVTAVGTAFDVRRGKDKVTITVEEGVVDVGSRGPGGEPTVWRAEAGYQVTYSLRQRTASIAGVNPTAELAWRNGELAYIYEPLGTVVEDLNRYSARRIVIADPQVAQIPFTGTAFVTSLDGWLAGIEQAHPVSVSRAANGDIVLSARR